MSGGRSSLVRRIASWVRMRRGSGKASPDGGTYLFFDPCCGPTRESLALPAQVRDAAEALDGRRLTMTEALDRLRTAIALRGGVLVTPPDERIVFWHMPTGPSGGAHVFYLVRYR